MLKTRKKEIRIKAEEFRVHCNVSRYGIIDLFKECERCGYKLLRYPLGEAGDLGFSMRRDRDIVVFTNSCSRLSRELFTLAHEIGHIVLHMLEQASFIDSVTTISEQSTEEKEKEANYFAACLLMPEDEVSKFLDLEIGDFATNRLSAMDIARMMSEFHVSFEMALNRLYDLGKIDANEKVNLDNERNLSRVGNLLRCVGGDKRLNEASEEIHIPHEYIDYAIYNYNHSAIPFETLEQTLSYYGLSKEDVSDQLVEHSTKEDNLLDLIRGLNV